jgi:N-acetylmuramoyl-L-alanine amidase
MLRKSLLPLLYPVILLAFASFKPAPEKHTTTTHTQPGQHKLKTIIIDAGHGGPDGGAEGEYSNEAELTLAIALKLGKKLEDSLPNCKIVYTRKDHNLPGGLMDHNAANRLRATIANENHGDLFISIHVNDAAHPYKREVIGHRKETYYTGKGKKRTKHTRTVPIIKSTRLPATVAGTQTYIWAVGKNDQKKQFVANNEEEIYGEKADSTFQYFDSPEAKILASLRTQKYFNNSLLIANYVQDEITQTGRNDMGVQQRDWEGIWVLQATAMPSILVETGFICTPSEEDYLNSEKGQNEMSNCIYNAVIRYKHSIEGGH